MTTFGFFRIRNKRILNLESMGAKLFFSTAMADYFWPRKPWQNARPKYATADDANASLHELTDYYNYAMLL